jgi:hypothetical protein
MSAKHIPGPWVVDATNALGAYGVWTDYATHPGHDGAGYSSQICSLLPNQDEITREQRDANAALIASAPDLLAALKEVVAISDRKHDAWDKAKAAIAKAERSGAA